MSNREILHSYTIDEILEQVCKVVVLTEEEKKEIALNLKGVLGYE